MVDGGDEKVQSADWAKLSRLVQWCAWLAAVQSRDLPFMVPAVRASQELLSLSIRASRDRGVVSITEHRLRDVV